MIWVSPTSPQESLEAEEAATALATIGCEDRRRGAPKQERQWEVLSVYSRQENGDLGPKFPRTC